MGNGDWGCYKGLALFTTFCVELIKFVNMYT